MSLSPRPPVVLCHGLWMPAAAMGVLAHRLHLLGWRPVLFHYPTTHQPLAVTADQLHQTVARLAQEGQGQPVHVVGHSLGGLLAVALLQQHGACCQGGRVVCLGSPLAGSGTAQWLTHHPLGLRALGTAKDALIPGAQGCPSHTPVGMIAGTRPQGAGVLLRHLIQHPWLQAHLTAPPPAMAAANEPNDGTVWVRETQCEGLADHVLVNTHHTGLTWDERVARLCHGFLTHGRFQLA
jgi:pimeloyl-ACP methyl ester carboxylesterase